MSFPIRRCVASMAWSCVIFWSMSRRKLQLPWLSLVTYMLPKKCMVLCGKVDVG